MKSNDKKPYILTSSDNEIVLDLFQKITRADIGVESIKYRAEREEAIDSLDRLERWGYIRREGNKYFVSLAAVCQLKTDSAQRLLESCEKIFDFMRDWYKHNTTDQIQVDVVAEKVGLDLHEAQEAIIYLIEGSWWSGRTTDLYSPGAMIGASEGVLKYKKFNDLLSELHYWRTIRATNEINTNGATPTSAVALLAGEGVVQQSAVEQPRAMPAWLSKLPKEVRTLFVEVLRAQNLELRALPTMGVRAIIDAVSTKLIGDIGGFKEKLEALEHNGYIKRTDIEILSITVDVGSAAMHRRHIPSKKAVNLCIDVVEHLLRAVYVLHPESKAVKKMTPKRPPKTPRTS